MRQTQITESLKTDAHNIENELFSSCDHSLESIARVIFEYAYPVTHSVESADPNGLSAITIFQVNNQDGLCENMDELLSVGNNPTVSPMTTRP